MKKKKRVILVADDKLKPRKWPRPPEQPPAMRLSDLEPHLTLAELLSLRTNVGSAPGDSEVGRAA